MERRGDAKMQCPSHATTGGHMIASVRSRRVVVASGLAMTLSLLGGVVAAQRRVLRYVFLRGWGSPGRANGQLDGPRGVAVFGERVYVADAFNNRIQQFTRAGVFTR